MQADKKALFIKMDKRFSILVELVFFFALIHVANVLFWPGDLGFQKWTIHPYWAVILFLSAQYGLQLGFLSGLFASGLYVSFFYQHLPIRGGWEQFAEQGGLQLPLFFMSVGLLLGNIRQKYIVEEELKNKDLDEKVQEVKRLKEFVDANEKVRRVLEARIVGETSTIKTLYDSARKLDAFDVPDVLNGFLQIINQHFHVQKASVYFKEGESLILKTAIGWPESAKVEGKLDYEDSVMRLAFEEKKRLTVKDLLQRKDMKRFSSDLGQVLAMLPIRDPYGQVIGVVNIEKMDFFFFHNANLEIMDLMADWLSGAIERTNAYRRLNQRAILDDGDEVFLYPYFEHVLADEFKRGQAFGGRFSVAMIKIDQFGFFDNQAQRYLQKNLVAILRRRLKSTDKIFVYRIQGVLVVIALFTPAVELLGTIKDSQIDFQGMYGQLPGERGTAGLTVAVGDFSPEMKNPEEMIQRLAKECRVN